MWPGLPKSRNKILLPQIEPIYAQSTTSEDLVFGSLMQESAKTFSHVLYHLLSSLRRSMETLHFIETASFISWGLKYLSWALIVYCYFKQYILFRWARISKSTFCDTLSPKNLWEAERTVTSGRLLSAGPSTFMLSKKYLTHSKILQTLSAPTVKSVSFRNSNTPTSSNCTEPFEPRITETFTWYLSWYRRTCIHWLESKCSKKLISGSFAVKCWEVLHICTLLSWFIAIWSLRTSSSIQTVEVNIKRFSKNMWFWTGPFSDMRRKHINYTVWRSGNEMVQISWNASRIKKLWKTDRCMERWVYNRWADDWPRYFSWIFDSGSTWKDHWVYRSAFEIKRRFSLFWLRWKFAKSTVSA